MERKSLVLIVSIFIGLAFLLVALSMIGGYNGLVNLDEDINSKYAQIEVRLQERHDKIGQILGAVTGLQEHAESIYTMITDARTAYAQAVSDGDMDAMIEADALTALSFAELLVVVEDNPLITANAGYYQLIDEISSMESALAVARRDFNEAVEVYNAAVRRFPRVLYASMFGFEKNLAYWKMNDGADEVPVIEFD